MRPSPLLAALVVLAVALLAPAAGALPPAPPGPVRSQRSLGRLVVAAPAPLAGYRRDRFLKDWETISNRCDVRELVLQRDGSRVRVDAACRPTAGRWRSYYDGKVIRDPSKVDIDHVVPLANAWISGARKWTPGRRRAFANDLRDPQLIAVSESANESKGDRSPDEWRPPRRAAWCLYARWWIAVKARWSLTVTAGERIALPAMLSAC